MSRKKKAEEAEKTEKGKAKKGPEVHITARDLGQDYIMKNKMVTAIVIALMLAVGLVVFIALYVEEKERVQATYRQMYQNSITAVLDDIDSYQNADGDFDLRYRMLVADMSNLNSYAFLINDFTEEQKSVNSLYTVIIKYPEQTADKMDEITTCLEEVMDGLDKGYDDMDAFVESIDLKGF
ncbi:MAG: hypothetical protein K6E28_04115 [Eubacterium sp.]|nr:hypothetical protein [Eubacterium sp.]